MEVVYLWRSAAASFIHQCVGGMRKLSAPIRDRISDTKSQKKLILTIVCVALLLDNMLYMVIVPIITEYFKKDNATATATTVSNDVYRNTAETKLVSNSTELQPHPNVTTTEPYSRHFIATTPSDEYPANEDALTGILFASKAIVQLMANPFTGTFIDKVGYVIPLTMGLLVMFTSTTLFAFAESYGILFLARSMQGLGSALADTASLGLIADRFHDEKERSKALGIALAFISFGSLVAPPFGGFLCQYAGREWPFLILSFICLIDSMLLLLVQIPASDENKAKDGNIPVGTPIYKLFIDPYIAVIAVALMIANFPLAFLEPTIAKWMEVNMKATKFQIGLVWLPAFIPHVIGVYLTVKLTDKYFQYQWLYGAFGLVLIGVSTAAVPTCKTYAILMLPLAFMCFGIALIDTALLPTLAFLVDVRHTSVYGSVYAIADISYSVAYSLGPILAGQTVHILGYLKMNVGIGLVNMMYAPLLLFLREVYDWKPDNSERIELLDPENSAPKKKKEEAVTKESNKNEDYDNNYVVKRPSTRHASVVSSEDEEDMSSFNRSKRSKHKNLKPNGNFQSNGTAASNSNQNNDSVIQTSIKPRPRPRTSSSTKSKKLHMIEESISKQKDNSTNFIKNESNNQYSDTIGSSDRQSSFDLNASISKEELRILSASGVEFHNPLFEQ